MRGKRQNIVGEQHVTVNEAGEVTGLFSIDALKARAYFGQSKFWEGVEHLIREYELLNPTEMQIMYLENAVQKVENKNVYGSTKDKATRHCISIPFGLMNLLETYEKTLFTNKTTRHKFMTMFPKLRACMKV